LSSGPLQAVTATELASTAVVSTRALRIHVIHFVEAPAIGF
jgi:hypothetical protein